MIKLIKWFLIICILLIIGAVVLLYFSLDHIVKSVVQTQGSEQLKVPVTVGGVDLGLIRGSVGMSKLAIGSPPGFSSPTMMSIGGMTVDSGGFTNLRSNPIRIKLIQVDSPTLVIEQSGGKLNFKALMDGLPKSTEKAPATPATPAKPAPGKETKLIIDDMAINNAHVKLEGGIPGMTKEFDIPLKNVDVKDIGNANGAQNGVAIKDVATTLISEMVSAAAGSGKLPPEVSVLLTGNLASIKDKLTASAQDRLSTYAAKLKVPAGMNGAINKIMGNKNNNGNGNAAQNLLNQGFGAFRKATNQPSK